MVRKKGYEEFSILFINYEQKTKYFVSRNIVQQFSVDFFCLNKFSLIFVCFCSF